MARTCTGACGWQVPQCAKVAAPREKRARTIRNPAGPLASRVRWWQLLYDVSCASAAMPRLAATLLRRGREALVISALAERRELTKVRGCCASSVALEEHVEQPREVRRDESHWHRERHKQAVVLVLTQPIEKPVACRGHEGGEQQPEAEDDDGEEAQPAPIARTNERAPFSARRAGASPANRVD